MIFDRRRIYLIGAAVALLVLVSVIYARPQITPAQRVREQLALLSHEPWTLVRIQDLEFVGTGGPEQVLLRGTRLDNGTPLVVGYVAQSPYTSPATMQRLREQNLAGRVSEVLLLPRSVAVEPYGTQLQTAATHVGVGFFAGLPEWTAKAKSEVAPEPAPVPVPEVPLEPAPPTPSAPADSGEAAAPAAGQHG